MRYTKNHFDRISSVIKKEYGIKIKRLSEEWTHSNSNCYAVFQSINVGTIGARWLVLGALVHEFGHCLSVQLGTSPGLQLGMLYRLGYPMSKRNAKIILEEERRAWNHGFALLRKNGIPVDEDMQRLKKLCVGTHITKLKKQ